MRRFVAFVCIILVAAVIGSCGKKEKPEPETVATTDQPANQLETPSNRANSRDQSVLQGSVLDTLRAKKKRFNITRDEYWDGHGGVLANDYFEVWYTPGRTTVTHGMYVFEELMPAREKLKSFFGE
ncbi:MAG: hypothetical protein P8181_10245, partial [bacterium]